MLRVTDLGFWMNPTLKSNLDSLILNASNDWDFVIIISGSGTTRTGKSVLAQQIAYYISYNRKRPFTLKDNVVFDGNVLINKAKLSRELVFVYDEAREGLNAKDHYKDLNRKLLNFFAECGKLNHFLIIVLPDYFELPKSIAITRSICLINCYTEIAIKTAMVNNGDIVRGQKYAKLIRGYYDYYNRNQKRMLYLMGKKEQDYSKVKGNFKGEYPNYWVYNRDEYEAMKDLFLKRETNEVNPDIDKFLKSKKYKKWYYERNVLIKYLNNELKLSANEINNIFKKEGINLDISHINAIIRGVSDFRGGVEGTSNINTHRVESDESLSLALEELRNG